MSKKKEIFAVQPAAFSDDQIVARRKLHRDITGTRVRSFEDFSDLTTRVIGEVVCGNVTVPEADAVEKLLKVLFTSVAAKRALSDAQNEDVFERIAKAKRNASKRLDKVLTFEGDEITMDMVSAGKTIVIERDGGES